MTKSRSRAALLDVNVLIALAWPNHEGHAAARDWFARHSAGGWSTTPITETGFVRISSNRRALATATTPRRAKEMLQRLTALPGHTFWPDTVQHVTGDHLDPAHLQGHHQVTDAHLVALCMVHGGALATFDQGIDQLVPSGEVGLHILSAAG